MKFTSTEHVLYINCFECQNKKQFVHTTCSELVVFKYWTCNSMNNLLSYCGLVEARKSASDKDLPVSHHFLYEFLLEQEDGSRLLQECVFFQILFDASIAFIVVVCCFPQSQFTERMFLCRYHPTAQLAPWLLRCRR